MAASVRTAAAADSGFPRVGLAQRVLQARAAPAPADWRGTIRSRLLVCAALFAAWTVGIEARLLYLQVLQHGEMMARADRQQLKTITLPAKRGEIVDRAGRVLAYSVDADTIAADPSDIEDPDSIAQLVCDELDDCAPAQQQLMAERLRGKGQFAYLARWVSPEEARRVKALDLQGVLFFKESRRYYPKKELAAHVLGYVGVDKGSGGARIHVRRAHPRAAKARCCSRPTRAGTRCRPARSARRPPATGSS